MSQGFTLLIERSDETQILTDTVRRFVLPHLRRRHALLDVGAGTGRMTHALGPEFDEITAIEPNPLFHAHLLADSRVRRPPFSAINAKIEAVTFPANQRFDLILLCHALYYIAANDWSPTFQNLRNHLRPGGVIAVVLWSAESEAYRFSKRICPQLRNCVSEQLHDFLPTVGMSFTSYRVAPTICPRSFQEATDLMHFLTLHAECGPAPVATSSRRQAIWEAIRSHGLKSLTNTQEMIVASPRSVAGR